MAHLTRIANKNHQCTLCERMIPSGEEYVWQQLKPWDHPDNDGYFVLKAHRYPCYEALLDSADEDGWQLMPGYNEFVDMLDERDAAVVRTFTEWGPK